MHPHTAVVDSCDVGEDIWMVRAVRQVSAGWHTRLTHCHPSVRQHAWGTEHYHLRSVSTLVAGRSGSHVLVHTMDHDVTAYLT